ncbi:nucleolar GTP-binding protein 1 isoform X2 [Eutrema salsugineum]|uniref:nucleolar GTP-binding protein 1 isoform X2 n=1 Tax=Eutrema salsugineum TaxID=72664 RepID=UPI000CECE44A|nr:nucleolar GTP-binding protein 1 isoform X2 [Eutrema salsugineum]XP_024015408.1 nucleolar GTP-binding protein 1 isoform X2 [Eutrema salsugineum]
MEEEKKSFKKMTKKVRDARNLMLDKLILYSNELPTDYNDELLYQRFQPFHCILARDQLRRAVQVIGQMASYFIRLLKKDECDSLDQCKRLKVTALGCMYTVAMRCLPSLAFLDRIRQYMANLEDDENASTATATATLTIKTDQDVLAEERCTVPNYFDAHKLDGFVDPETMSWLWELESKHGALLQDDVQVMSSMEALVI